MIPTYRHSLLMTSRSHGWHIYTFPTDISKRRQEHLTTCSVRCNCIRGFCGSPQDSEQYGAFGFCFLMCFLLFSWLFWFDFWHSGGTEFHTLALEQSLLFRLIWVACHDTSLRFQFLSGQVSSCASTPARWTGQGAALESLMTNSFHHACLLHQWNMNEIRCWPRLLLRQWDYGQVACFLQTGLDDEERRWHAGSASTLKV